MNILSIEKKNSFCQAKNEFVNFYQTLVGFTRQVADVRNSPWNSDSSPLPYFIRRGEDKLGKKQRDTIDFLHQRYFRWGKPCYLRTGNLAKKVGVRSQANMVHIISSLVERGILIRINFMYNRCNRSVLLPSLPRIRPAVKKILTRPQNYIRGSVILFDKLPELLRKESLSIYNNIQLLSVIITNKLKIPIRKLLRSLVASRKQTGKLFGLMKGWTMQQATAIKRLKLRCKETDKPLVNPIDRQILVKMKLHHFKPDPLNFDERKRMIELFEFRTGIDLNRLLPYLKLVNQYYEMREGYKAEWETKDQLVVWQMAMEMLHDGIVLDYINSKIFMERWNEKLIEFNNNKFSKIRIIEKSKTYTQAVIYLTHVLNYKAQSIAAMENAIDLIAKIGDKIRWRTKPGWKIPMSFVFLSKCRNIKYYDRIFTNTPDQFYQDSMYYTYGHIDAFDEKVVPKMVNHLFNGNTDKALSTIRTVRPKLMAWFHKLAKEFKPETSRHETCGFKLIRANENAGLASIMEEYLMYVSNFGYFIPISEIVKDSMWLSFVQQRMRTEYGFSDFWKFKLTKAN